MPFPIENAMRRLVLPALCLTLAVIDARAAEVDVWIGTTTPADGDSRGVYHLTLDEEAGRLSRATLAAEAVEPGFLAAHPSLDVVYSTGDVDGEPSVTAWRVVRDGERASLERLNAQPIGDGGSAHVAVDQTGRVLLSAQYGGGSAASFPLDDDGAIGPRASLIEHDTPSGVVADRQASCHPHWVGVSPDNRFVLVPDLGADRVFVHRLDPDSAKLTEHSAAPTPPGGGPRHFTFHPAGREGYVVNELELSLSRLTFDAAAGELMVVQTIPTLSESQKAAERFNSGSEVRVHPTGRFVYCANRGHDSITAFAIDQATGELSLIEQEPIRGAWPRNFALSPSGRWLLAAGRDSHTLAVFEIDPNTGELQYTLHTRSVPHPICVLVDE